jgi:antitoxin CptB
VPELNSLFHTVELGTLLNTQEWNRLRWQCRRGLLELDLVLERFLEKYGDRLQGERLSSFQTLLTYTDDELWDLIRARTECRDARFAEVVQWMRNCRDRTGSLRSAESGEPDDGVRS